MKNKALHGGGSCGASRYPFNVIPAMVTCYHGTHCRPSGGSLVARPAGFPRNTPPGARA